MIHEVDGCFVISSSHVWMPGRYESHKAANYAFRFSDEVLSQLQDAANKRAGGFDGVITFEDLQKARKAQS